MRERARIVALAAALWRARAADEAALAASVSTDASGLFTLGYYWYGILRQPSFHEEFEKCYDALDLDGYYGYGLVAYCQFLDYFIDDSAMCKSNYKYMCEEDTRIKLLASDAAAGVETGSEAPGERPAGVPCRLSLASTSVEMSSKVLSSSW